MKSIRRVPLHLLVLAILSLVPAIAQAQAFPDSAHRFQFSLAGNLSSIDTQVSLGPPGGGTGASLVFEDLFDIPVHEQFLELQGTWKYAGRNYLDLGYLNLERTNRVIVDRDVQFGEYTFHAGAEVEASFASRFFYLAYRRDLLQLAPVRISVSAGITQTLLRAGMTGSGNITDQNGQVVTGTRSRDSKVKLPVPMLGFQVEWDVTARNRILAFHRFIGLETSDIRGAMLESTLRYHYFVTPHWGLGAGFETVSVELPRYTTEDFTARFSYGIVGATLYLQSSF